MPLNRGSGLSSLFRNSFVYGVNQILLAAFGLVITFTATRALTQSEYGLVAVLISVGTMSKVIFGLSLDTSMSRYYHDPAWTEIALFRSVVGLLYRSVSVGVLLSCVLAAWIAIVMRSSEIFILFAMVIVWASLEVFMVPRMTLLRMRRESGAYFVISVGSSFLSTIAVVTFLLKHSSVVSYLIGLIVGPLAGLLVCRRIFEFSKLGSDHPGKDKVRSLLKFGLPLIVSSIAMLINSNLDRWALGMIVGIDAVAVYSVAFQLASSTQLLVGSFALAFGPESMRIIQETRDRASVVLSSYLRLYTLGSSIFVVSLTAVSPALISAVATNRYTSASRIIGMLALSITLYGLTYFTSLGSWKSNHSSDYSIAIVIGVGMNATLNVLLVRDLKIVGVALATMAGMTLTVLISASLGHYRYRYRLGYPRVIVALLCAYIAVWFLSLNPAFEASVQVNTPDRILVVVVFVPVAVLTLYGRELTKRIFRFTHKKDCNSQISHR